MYNTILVPLDGSKRAEAILPHVQKLAGSGQSKVILLTAMGQRQPVVAPREAAALNPLEDEKRFQATEHYLNQLAEEIRRMDIRVETKVVYGAAVETIIKVAEEERADLIAIASHGRTGLARVFYGSISAGVLNAVDRPLLLIRSRSLE